LPDASGNLDLPTGLAGVLDLLIAGREKTWADVDF